MMLTILPAVLLLASASSGSAEDCDWKEIAKAWTPEVEAAFVKKTLAEGKQEQEGKRTFYMTYGPPASGKGGIMKSAFAYEASKQYITQQNGVPVIVDDIVGAVPGFVEERKKCTSITSSQALYMGLRKGKTIRQNRKTLDDLSDEILQAGLDAGKNIIWETTGESTAWTTRITMTQAIDKGYRVVTVYPFVYTSTLIERAAERQRKTGQIPAPAAAIRHTAAVAALNINSIFTYYFWRQDAKEIKEDCVYIYDNNGPTPGSQQMLIGLKNNHPKPIVLDVYKGCKPAFPAPGKKSSTDWDMSDPAAPVLKAFIETHAGERCTASTDVSTKELSDPEGQDAHADQQGEKAKERTKTPRKAKLNQGGPP